MTELKRSEKHKFIFELPKESERESYANFSSKQEVIQAYKFFRQKNNKRSIFRYKISLKQGRHSIYIYCRQCRSKITYWKDKQGSWRIQKWENIHTHEGIQENKTPENQVISLQKDFKNKLYFIGSDDIRHSAFQQIPQLGRKYINQIYLDVVQEYTFQDFLSGLDQKHFSYRSFQNPNNVHRTQPDIFIAFSPEMIELCRKFGEVVYFDYEQKLESNALDGNQIKLAIFTGMGNNAEMLALGVGFLKQVSKESLKWLIENFFAMSSSSSRTIITDGGQLVSEAIDQLIQGRKFNGFRLIDPYFLLKSLEQRGLTRKAILLYKKAVTARSVSEFRAVVAALTELKQQSTILENFVDSSPTYCLSMIPASFVGLAFSQSMAKKLKKYYCNELFANGSHFARVLIQITKKFIPQKTKPQNQKQFFKLIGEKKSNFPQISQVVFAQFMLNYVSSFELNTTIKDNSGYTVEDRRGQSVKVNQNGQQLSCECRYNEKVGLPCTHIFKVMWTLGLQDYKIYVADRWKINKNSVNGKEQVQNIQSMEQSKQQSASDNAISQ